MTDLKKILDSYDIDDDFGFSTVSEEEYNENSIDSYKKRLLDVEKLILPFLIKLVKTADSPYIHWPNRKEQIEKQIERIVKLTRT